jgi:hypothetical protein
MRAAAGSLQGGGWLDGLMNPFNKQQGVVDKYKVKESSLDSGEFHETTVVNQAVAKKEWNPEFVRNATDEHNRSFYNDLPIASRLSKHFREDKSAVEIAQIGEDYNKYEILRMLHDVQQRYYALAQHVLNGKVMGNSEVDPGALYTDFLADIDSIMEDVERNEDLR